MAQIVDATMRDRLLSDMDFQQDTDARSLLFEAGVLDATDLDHASAKDFISRNSADFLGKLPIAQVIGLVKKLFSGGTYNAEEDALIKLFRAQNRERRVRILREPETSWDSWTYQLDGGQDTTFRDLAPSGRTTCYRDSNDNVYV
jgi:hypothetical protein